MNLFYSPLPPVEFNKYEAPTVSKALLTLTSQDKELVSLLKGIGAVGRAYGHLNRNVKWWVHRAPGGPLKPGSYPSLGGPPEKVNR